ncbi:hypothetical protein KL925_004284, partial [Ogataea polymorpha]
PPRHPATKPNESDVEVEGLQLYFWEHYQLSEDNTIPFSTESSLRPKNWSSRKRFIHTIHTILYGTATFAVQFASTMMSSPVFPDLFEK